jgi:hypothetical protein
MWKVLLNLVRHSASVHIFKTISKMDDTAVVSNPRLNGWEMLLTRTSRLVLILPAIGECKNLAQA